jgi:ABC-type polysaccharide/polyol phosphate export permease
MRVTPPGSPAALREGILQADLWLYLGRQIIVSRFRNSRLGFIWLVIQNLVFSAGAGYIWSVIFGADPRFFIPFIAVGFGVWGTLSACFTDGSLALVTAGGYLKQLPIPQIVFILRYIVAQSVFLCVGVATATLTGLVLGHWLSWGALWALPGMVIFLFAMSWTVLITSYLTARFRDVPHAMQSLFQLLFVVTPVLYSPDLLVKRGLGWAVYFNPLNAFLDIVRTPIMRSTAASPIDYTVALLYTVFVVTIGLLTYRQMAPRLVYDL